MAKPLKRIFVCSDCSANFPRWQGQCNECNSWNTITEIKCIDNKRSKHERFSGYTGLASNSKIEKLSDVKAATLPRFSSGLNEFDRVLGGGIVPGSVVLIGGQPGAGKSTLLLQILNHISTEMPTLYITGEESLQQVAMRAHRLNLKLDNLYLLSETSIEQICYIAKQTKPQLIIIDSIQVMYVNDVQSSPGSVAQVREAAAYLTRLAKNDHIVIIMVGHVTKDGLLAGPKVLEHCIDCSVMLEGQHGGRFRTLRSHKNRFGAINELGIFAMTEQGLKEITNPSAIFLSRGNTTIPGSAVTVIWEGTRPLLIEIQALVDRSVLENPRRVIVGLDQSRVALLTAILHRYGDIQMANQDIFINVVGGVKITETSSDLALLLALISSLRNQPLADDLIIFGEMGLGGEIRPVPSGQERIVEAVKHGFKKAVIPQANLPKKSVTGIDLYGISKLSEALTIFNDITN